MMLSRPLAVLGVVALEHSVAAALAVPRVEPAQDCVSSRPCEGAAPDATPPTAPGPLASPVHCGTFASTATPFTTTVSGNLPLPASCILTFPSSSTSSLIFNHPGHLSPVPATATQQQRLHARDGASPSTTQSTKPMRMLSMGEGVVIGIVCVCAVALGGFLVMRWWRRRRTMGRDSSYLDNFSGSNIQSIFSTHKATRPTSTSLDKADYDESETEPETDREGSTPRTRFAMAHSHAYTASRASSAWGGPTEHLAPSAAFREHARARVAPPPLLARLDLSNAASPLVVAAASRGPNGDVEFEIQANSNARDSTPYTGIVHSPSEINAPTPTPPKPAATRRSILKLPRLHTLHATNPGPPSPSPPPPPSPSPRYSTQYAPAAASPRYSTTGASPRYSVGQIIFARWSRMTHSSGLPEYEPPLPDLPGSRNSAEEGSAGGSMRDAKLDDIAESPTDGVERAGTSTARRTGVVGFQGLYGGGGRQRSGSAARRSARTSRINAPPLPAPPVLPLPDLAQRQRARASSTAKPPIAPDAP